MHLFLEHFRRLHRCIRNISTLSGERLAVFPQIAPGAIRPIAPLGDDAFEPHGAGVLEQCVTASVPCDRRVGRHAQRRVTGAPASNADPTRAHGAYRGRRVLLGRGIKEHFSLGGAAQGSAEQLEVSHAVGPQATPSPSSVTEVTRNLAKDSPRCVMARRRQYTAIRSSRSGSLCTSAGHSLLPFDPPVQGPAC